MNQNQYENLLAVLSQISQHLSNISETLLRMRLGN